MSAKSPVMPSPLKTTIDVRNCKLWDGGGFAKKATAESIALHLFYAPLEEATPKKTQC